MLACSVEITKNAEKDLQKVPSPIKTKLLLWVDAVERLGIHKVRQFSGFNDEALKGQRKGQRFIPIANEDANFCRQSGVEHETFLNRKTSKYLRVFLRLFSIRTFHLLAILTP